MVSEIQLPELLLRRYGLHAERCVQSRVGAGSDTWFADCREGRYVVKFPSVSGINHPETEVELCRHLLQKGLPVCRFLPDAEGRYLSVDDEGSSFHVQAFIDGTCPALNSAESWLLDASAVMLGRIHAALADYPVLPVGIGEDFFRYMTPDAARRSYERSIGIAEKELPEVAGEIAWRIALTERMQPFRFDPERLTCCNTHGDYFLSQLLCGEGEIRAVIDWTTACVHPAVWEIIRSYVYAAPECAQGRIDPEGLARYVRMYRTQASLTREDLELMVPLFFFQLAVCDYYGQYFGADTANRHIYLHQARFSTALLQHMESCGAALTERLLREA